MPWKDPEKRREYRRLRYAQQALSGEKRSWGTISAICPSCSNVRQLSKNQHGIVNLPKNENGDIIRRCRACSKRKDYAPWFDQEYVRDYQWKRRQTLKIECVKYLGSKCQDCGYLYTGDNSYAFDFHHRDPEQKDFLPAAKNRQWDSVKKELDKCDLLCAICHRKKHTIL